ncbi:DUF4349 domain-containing protein [Mucilaginibacter pedocola]|uniref:DUF4349 domain-containing protein n=1 Tax=Mucilaginibacter pedocola TaxID=1792845 RepID=A0A1S9PDA2_9SPHI|nr:DUF4349 domain-containing protein [Mucilaginibacter pedocola]OOQ58837.1 hypothetical protein BC343_09335 [Mucilaginibacter pedocola]
MRTKILVVLAGVALLAACKGKSGNYEYANTDNRSATADTVGIAADTTIAENAKLIKTADMAFKVKNVQRTGDSVSALTNRYGGMVMHHQMHSNVVNSQDIRVSDDSVMHVSAFSTAADMTVRVPSEKLEDFMVKVSHMGMYITSRQMDIADKSLDYLSEKMKLNNRRELIAQQKSGKINIKDPSAVLWLKDDLVDGQINNQRIDAAVKYSNISLAFYQSNTIVKEMVANDDPSSYQLPFFKRLWMAIVNGWLMFTEVILALANLWVFGVMGLGLWLAYRVYRKRFVTVPKSIITQ